MPRTVIVPQSLTTPGGAALVWTGIDGPNGMQAVNTGRSAVLIEGDALTTGTVTFPSFACSHGRTETLTAALPVSSVKSFGPFPPNLWGDGAGNLQIDFAGLNGTSTVRIAVVETG